MGTRRRDVARPNMGWSRCPFWHRAPTIAAALFGLSLVSTPVFGDEVVSDLIIEHEGKCEKGSSPIITRAWNEPEPSVRLAETRTVLEFEPLSEGFEARLAVRYFNQNGAGTHNETYSVPAKYAKVGKVWFPRTFQYSGTYNIEVSFIHLDCRAKAIFLSITIK